MREAVVPSVNRSVDYGNGRTLRSTSEALLKRVADVSIIARFMVNGVSHQVSVKSPRNDLKDRSWD
jgi:hypothetical protein